MKTQIIFICIILLSLSSCDSNINVNARKAIVSEKIILNKKKQNSFETDNKKTFSKRNNPSKKKKQNKQKWMHILQNQ